MGRLLSEPISRKRIWREKTGVLSAVLLSVLIAERIVVEFAANIRYAGYQSNLVYIGYTSVIAMWMLCVGPYLALHSRKGQTTFWAALVSIAILGPSTVFLVAVILDYSPEPSGILSRLLLALRPTERAHSYPVFATFCKYGILPLFPWCILGWLLARRRFFLLEV